MFPLVLCSEVMSLRTICKKRQKLAVKFSSGLDQTLTSTFRVHCSSLVCINLYDSNVGAHGTASKSGQIWFNLLQHWNHIGLTDVRYGFIGLCSEFRCHLSWLILKCHWLSHSWLRRGYLIYSLDMLFRCSDWADKSPQVQVMIVFPTLSKLLSNPQRYILRAFRPPTLLQRGCQWVLC